MVYSILQLVKCFGTDIRHFRTLFLLTSFTNFLKYTLLIETSTNNWIAYLKDSKSCTFRCHCNCHWLHRGNLKDRQMSKITFSK